MKSIIKYFYFNKNERLALFIFLILLLLINLCFYFFKEEAKYVHYEHPEFQADWIAIDSLENQPKVYASQKFIQLSKKKRTSTSSFKYQFSRFVCF